MSTIPATGLSSCTTVTTNTNNSARRNSTLNTRSVSTNSSKPPLMKVLAAFALLAYRPAIVNSQAANPAETMRKLLQDSRLEPLKLCMTYSDEYDSTDANFNEPFLEITKRCVYTDGREMIGSRFVQQDFYRCHQELTNAGSVRDAISSLIGGSSTEPLLPGNCKTVSRPYVSSDPNLSKVSFRKERTLCKTDSRKVIITTQIKQEDLYACREEINKRRRFTMVVMMVVSMTGFVFLMNHFDRN